MAQEILGNFDGWLMSDGYGAYRFYEKRIRCWAHLDRKAKGLADSWDRNTAAFGAKVVATLKALEKTVYQMRMLVGSERSQQQQIAENLEAELCIELLRKSNASHEPTARFSGEILHDPQAIFAVLRNPDLPLTNNIAEQALRPMVIMRKISHGSKTPEGSRAIALLASVCGTLTRRCVETPTFLRDIFKSRRAGFPSPPLPDPRPA